MKFAWWLLTMPFRMAFLLASPHERKVTAELARIDALEKEGDFVGLIQMLDSDLRGRSLVSLRQFRAVRGHAAFALGRLGDPRAIPHLMELGSHPDESARQEAILALGQLKAKEAEGFLLEALGDPAKAVRSCAASALGRIGATDAVPRLRELLESDPDPAVQFSALEALVILGDPPSLDRVDKVFSALNPSSRKLPAVMRVREAVERGEPLTPFARWDRNSRK